MLSLKIHLSLVLSTTHGLKHEGLLFKERMWQECADHYALLQQDIGARTTSAASPCGKAEYLHIEKRVHANCSAIQYVRARLNKLQLRLAKAANAHTGAAG